MKAVHYTCVAFCLSVAGTTAVMANAHVDTRPAAIQRAGPEPASTGYARIAGLVVDAPLAIDATIRRTSALPAAQSPGLAPGQVRLYVQADVAALIRGTAGVAPRIAYLADVPLDSRGRVPKLRKQRVLLFARAVAGRPGEVQLVRPDAQLPWSPPLDATVRAVAAEVVGPDAAPAVTGIASAVHTPGNLVGEGETTVFVTTASGDPISLTVLRRPGQARSWSVSLGEVVTDTAGPPRPETLLWYRLACGLPETLPEAATASLGPADAAPAREDYAFIREQLGACAR